MRTEKQLQDYSKREAKKNMIGFYKMECVGQTGFPDAMFVKNGHIVFVEFKSPAKTGRLSPRQKYMINRLEQNQAEVYVVNNKEDTDAIITGLVERQSATLYLSLI